MTPCNMTALCRNKLP